MVLPYTHKGKMNTIFYIIDKSLNPPEQREFNSYGNLVRYLDIVSQRAFKQTKQQRTQLLEECGHGTDDYNSTLFVRSMQEQFEIGVIRAGRRTQCDVTTMVAYQKPEYGD
jgi:hypothetical protein